MKLTQLISPASGLLTLSLLFSGQAFAQAPTCRLSVTVIDKTGDLIEGAKVVLRPPDSACRPPSHVTEPGEFIFDRLRPGFYTLIATKARYKRTIQTESLLCVEPEDPISTEVVLERGNPRQTVTNTVLRLVERASRVPGPESPTSTPDVKKDVSLPQEDYGVDIAAVIVAQDYLVEKPGSDTIVLKVASSDLLALVERTPTVGSSKEGWYQVIHVNSGVEGWIRGEAIKVKFSELKKSTPLFREERTKRNGNPRVDIKNDSDADLTFRIKGKAHVVAPHSKRIIYLQSGTFKYYGFAPGVMPAFGEQNFRAGHKYTWQFWAGVKVS